MPNERADVFKHYDMSGGLDSCWAWSGTTGGRASEPRPYFQAEGKRYLAYRLVYELVHGVTLTKEEKLLHSCDNGSMPVGCGNPRHLRIGTTQDNSDDMKERDRHGLPAHVVSAIRRLLSQQRTQADIAELYGISRETVSAIATGRSHSHVTEPTEC
jgi:hypothetical protein